MATDTREDRLVWSQKITALANLCTADRNLSFTSLLEPVKRAMSQKVMAYEITLRGGARREVENRDL